MKKIFAVLLSLLVIWSMAACGARSAAPETTAKTQIQATQPETLPQVTEPEETVPEVIAPEEDAPEVTVPEVIVPEVTVPEVTVPEVTAPEETTPEVAEPQVTVPEETVPEAETVTPPAPQPETKPETTTPAPQPETKPETTTPAEPQHTHKYTKTVTAPTCVESGYTVNTCSCGSSYKSDYKDPVGHSYGQWVVTKEPTVNETGLEERICKTCSNRLTRTMDKLNAPHTCNFYYTETRNPTCQTEGYERMECSCGAYTEKTLPVLEHNYTRTKEISATCTERSYSYFTCKDCGIETLSDCYQEARGHDYRLTSSSASTCVVPGTMVYTCTRCDDSYTEYLTLINHKWQRTSCQDYDYCTVCGKAGTYIEHDVSYGGKCRYCRIKWCTLYGHADTGTDVYCYWAQCGDVLPEIEEQVEDILARIIKSGMTEFQKVKTIHDYICNNAEYDWENYVGGTIPDTSYTARGFLDHGVIVCDGYAKTFKLLCNYAGIQCERVSGWGAGGLHAWNQVQIDGKWYNVDVCWDDEDDATHPIEYVYFLTSDQQFYKSHLAKDAKYVCEETYPEDGFRRMFYYY